MAQGRRTSIRYFRGLNRRKPAHLLEEGELSALRNMESRTGGLRKRGGVDIIGTTTTPENDFWASAVLTLSLPREEINISVQNGTTTDTEAAVIYDHN